MFSPAQNLTPLATRSPPTPPTSPVLRITPRTESEVALLREDLPVAVPTSWWREPSYPAQYVDAHFSGSNLKQAQALLDNAGFSYTTLIDDVQKAIDASYEPPSQLFTASNDVEFDYSKYHSLEEISDWMVTLEKTYPDLVSLVDVGKSFEGRTIKAVKFTGASSNSTATKAGLWLDGGIHAREWVSPATNVYVLGHLLDAYGKDDETTKLIDGLEWYILPVFNVDGYSYTWAEDGDRMWRKTRSTTSSKLCTGVDPNRNWDMHWGEAGTSKNPCADDFQGKSAFSEIEVSSVASFIQSQKNINGYVNFHSYSQLWMSPWGYTDNLPETEDYNKQNDVSEAAAAAIKAIHGSEFEFGPISKTIYPASGSSADWTYGVCGILYSYGVELRDTGAYGFLLPEDQIVPSGEEILPAVKVLAHAVLDAGVPDRK